MSTRLRSGKRGLADEPGEAARWTRLLRSVSGGNGFWVFLRQEEGSINTVNIYDTFSKNSYWWQSNKCTLFTGTRPFVSLSVVICHDSGNGGSLGERLHAGPQSKTLPIGLFMEKVRGL